MDEIAVYLAQCTDHQRSEFERVKGIVLDIVPDASQVISYGLPTFKLGDKTILHFGAFKHHMSIFPGSGSVYNKMGDKLKKFKVSKGTLQFTKDNPISDELVKEIVQIRFSDIVNTQ